ncbi:uncharacterized protein LOC124944425 [Impatiens glandulifera]|uniref:uncharacterized protein LOC124944425 n=1 Tax=Impatiens glandulifera TaxID=253017 RepID=UPI001FB135FB|nr:uncharacterized protein LOC124944425 [Impatiens glandulifera]
MAVVPATASISSPFPWSGGCSSTTMAVRLSITIPKTKFSFTTVRSSKSRSEELDSRSDEPSRTSQEDLMYLGKLGAGSIIGAIAIKYGSILLPEITTPNIYLALFMIFAPCVLAVFVLIWRSQIESMK